MRTHIENFNPDVNLLQDTHQDFLMKVRYFNAGRDYVNFNDFIAAEAVEYAQQGEGVTYVVWNIIYNEEEVEIGRDLVAFYTLATTAIPYEDRVRRDEEEAKETGEEFDIQICGIPALEIKMFAVAEKYQDVFYKYEGEDMPISAWIMRSIIDTAESMLKNTIGFKALFLHSVPGAEKFYEHNGFSKMAINMRPLHSLDSEYTAMCLSLREVEMNYDK